VVWSMRHECLLQRYLVLSVNESWGGCSFCPKFVSNRGLILHSLRGSVSLTQSAALPLHLHKRVSETERASCIHAYLLFAVTGFFLFWKLAHAHDCNWLAFTCLVIRFHLVLKIYTHLWALVGITIFTKHIVTCFHNLNLLHVHFDIKGKVI